MSKLYLVPTPVGNLQDMTFRAVEILKTADFVLAEDTRTSGLLLKHFEISKPMMAYHQHNEHRIVEKVVQRIASGEIAALVSDAGTPAISDPGYLLLRGCIRKGIPVECLPGATAFLPALIDSGLPADRFLFEGFLPHKKGRKTKLEFLSHLPCTFILYESPHRLVKTLIQLAGHCGSERQASVSRELTKIYEETIRGTLAELIKHFETGTVKGEFVIVVAGK